MMRIPKLKSARLVDLLCAILLLSFSFAIAYPRWRAGIDWRDEGLLAYGAVRVMHGDIPHRDFVSLQPPLSFYTAAAVFKLFGTSLVSLRVFGVLLFLLLPILIYGIGRNFIGPLLSFAAAAPACILGLPYFRFMPLPAWQGIAVSLVAALVFLPAIFSERQWLAFPAGLLSAISLFLRQDQAVYAIVAILVLVVTLRFVRDDSHARTNLKHAVFFWLAGMAVVSIPLTVVWWRLGALPEMFRQLVMFPFTTYRKTSSLPFPRFILNKSVLETAIRSLFYIPPFVQTISAVYLGYSLFRRRFRVREAILLFLVVWSALFYLQVLVRSDQTHLLYTLPPVFLLCAFGWSMVLEAISNYRRTSIIVSAAVAILVMSYLWILRPAAFPDVTRENELLALPRGGVRIEQGRAITDFFKRLQAFVPPTRPILALPYQPMFYFLCERRNPTRWNYLWPGDQTTGDHERLIEEAERDPPAVVLLSQQRELVGYAPTIVEYVRTHYIHTDDVGDIGIYVRPGTN
jgi:hypothetical protein